MGVWKPLSPPTDSTDHAAPNKATTPPIKLRVLTYNVWFENNLKGPRTKALLEAVATEDPDICCFQEVTAGFEEALRQHQYWRKSYIMTSLGDQTQLTQSWYGTLIMAKRAMLERSGFDVSASFVHFPGTQTGRLLTMLNISSPGSTRTLRIGTIHLDYTPELRAAHLRICMQGLAASDPNASSLLCGDTNTSNYAEFDEITSAGYEDAWAVIHPDGLQKAAQEGVDGVLPDPTYGIYGIRVSTKGGGTKPLRGQEFPKRLDMVFCKALSIKDCKLVGDQPIPKDALKGGLPDEFMNGLTVWPSDHVGVCTEVEWAPE